MTPEDDSMTDHDNSELPSGSHRRPGTLQTLGQAPAAHAIGVHQNPDKPVRKLNRRLTNMRMLTVALVFPLFMILVMPLVMTGMGHDLHPRHMDVAVIGTGQQIQDQTDQLDESSLDRFDVHRVDSVDEAKDQVRDHTIRAAYDPADAKLYLAGANGRQVTQAVTELFRPVAQQAGMSLSTEDLQELKSSDSNGTSAAYLALGAALGGYMTGMILGLVPTRSAWRILFGIGMPALIATCEVLYGWAVFGIFDGSSAMPWLMLFLLGLSCTAVMLGGMLVLGVVMIPLGVLAMPLLGMSASGAVMPLDMMNPFYPWVHPWLFSAQGLAAVKDAIYFQDASLAQPVWVMLAWLAGGIALAVWGTVHQKRRHLFGMLDERERTEAVVAAAAAAAP